MDASSRGGEEDTESFWPGSGGSVCDLSDSDITLSPLVLSDSSSSTGAVCYGINLAEALSLTRRCKRGIYEEDLVLFFHIGQGQSKMTLVAQSEQMPVRNRQELGLRLILFYL